MVRANPSPVEVVQQGQGLIVQDQVVLNLGGQSCMQTYRAQSEFCIRKVLPRLSGCGDGRGNNCLCTPDTGAALAHMTSAAFAVASCNGCTL